MHGDPNANAKPLPLQSVRARVVMFSPLVLLLGGQLLARSVSTEVGPWSWLPLCLVYWAVVITLALWARGWRSVARWFGAGKSGAIGWKIVAVVMVLAPAATLLVPHAELLLARRLLLATVFFVVINPLAEEIYWRGLLLDATAHLPRPVALGVISVLFMLHHLWLQPVIPGGQTWKALVGALILGIVWGGLYQRTASLRWPWLTHVIVNVTALPVPVMLGLVEP